MTAKIAKIAKIKPQYQRCPLSRTAEESAVQILAITAIMTILAICG